MRELREARELHEAVMAEQGLDAEAPEVQFDPETVPQMDITDLHELARALRIWNYRKMRRSELVNRVLQTRQTEGTPVRTSGVLEILGEGYGFLRVSEYLPSPDDIYVSQGMIRRHDLWAGDIVAGEIRPPREGEKFQVLVRPETVNGQPTDQAMRRVPFENRTPIYPCERLRLETTASNLSMRLMDLFNPLGKGQRALIVSPPKAGKTTLLKQVANSITDNHPEVHLMALLIDERPEEVTDMQRSIKGEVIASTFDELPENHVRVAELVMERAKRMVELGHDVVILLDSITRLARAYNSAMPPSGRTLSGGLDPNAMHKPKRFFGAARKLERSGSLTIIATALIDTGSRMDEVIYEEFKGTGNSELTLDRRLADRRIFPAIDIKRSSTRKEELLLSPEELRKQRILRKTMDAGDTAEVTEFLADRLSRTKSNAEFLMAISDS
jgi:transcription termination factor Rho